MIKEHSVKTGQGGPGGRSHLSQLLPSKRALEPRTGSSSTPKGCSFGSPALLNSTQYRDLEESLRGQRDGWVVKNTDFFQKTGASFPEPT